MQWTVRDSSGNRIGEIHEDPYGEGGGGGWIVWVLGGLLIVVSAIAGLIYSPLLFWEYLRYLPLFTIPIIVAFIIINSLLFAKNVSIKNILITELVIFSIASITHNMFMDPSFASEVFGNHSSYFVAVIAWWLGGIAMNVGCAFITVGIISLIAFICVTIAEKKKTKIS